MSSVKSLPEAVRSSVRSGIILFDIARVVEELVFNSLDARASKVSIFVGIGTCYVKVSDDGTGIPRDGLELVGERYATSKFDSLVDTSDEAGSFGFRGEALASISDVSLLEIVTKASGRPNGYRKVMKGSKCLYLGIFDGIRDVGTTVSVRDLFYNQPVRRKYIQASPKKVLQSIKKCVTRIALVHSKVSFNFVDIESDEILLRTQASCPTSLLASLFGIDISTSLHKLEIGGGKLKLFGYVSGPCDNLSIKAFQYVYINSRFVSKGPIHKLVDQLAATFECNDQGKSDRSTRNRKRSRPQTNPAFILNINCPRSIYDLTFEPSKTYVEFKDWVPVLAFLEEAIRYLWNERMSYGIPSHCPYCEVPIYVLLSNSDVTVAIGINLSDVLGDTVGFAADIVDQDDVFSAEDLGAKGDSIIGKKKRSMRSRQASPVPICSDLNIPAKEGSDWSLKRHDLSQTQISRECSSYMNEQDKDLGFLAQSSQLGESPFPKSKANISRNCELLGNDWSLEKHDMSPIQVSREYSSYLDEQDNDMGFISQSDRLGDSPFSKSVANISEHEMYMPGNKFFPVEDHYPVSEASCGEWCTDNEDENHFSSRLGKRFFEGCPSNRNESACFSLTRDYRESSDVEIFRDVQEPFLRSCSSRGTLSLASSLLKDITCEFQDDKVTQFSTGFYDRIGDSDNRNRHHSFDCLTKNFGQDKEPRFEIFPTDNRHYLSAAELESLPGAFGKSIPFVGYQSDGNDDFIFGSVPRQKYGCNYHLEVDSERGSLTSHFYSRSTFWDDERYSNMNIIEGRRKPFVDDEENEYRYGYVTASCANSGFEDSSSGHYHQRRGLNHKFSPNLADTLSDETDCLSFDSDNKICRSSGMYKSQRCRNNQKRGNILHFSERRTRSHSAPPFYRSKRKFFGLHCSSTEEPDNYRACAEVREHLNSYAARNLPLDESSFRQELKKKQGVKEAESDTAKAVQSVCSIQDPPPPNDSIAKESQDPPICGTKWRNFCSKTSSNNKSNSIDSRDNILDISSGILHLASDSLVPECISKTCLENAMVLRQVDKKYIPIVAGRTLAAVDQHAADERVRVEELRQKVLTGEAKTITFLDAEQELTLPEIGHQLLHNYSEEIKKWGWMCNFHSRDSRSFKSSLNTLHRQPTAITLKAVPCILGVNLSDVDLMEFLQQLADTGGSSMIPPSVLRIINSKACRGAIMFGDSLLPSECSLLISELKQTSLCFQCAHGRPTTVPLVNLEALHIQIAKIPNDDPDGLWHGLRRHELSLERAQQRLRA